MWRYANIGDTFFDQKSSRHREVGFCDGTSQGHRNLETESAQRTNPVKISKNYQNIWSSILNIKTTMGLGQEYKVHFSMYQTPNSA